VQASVPSRADAPAALLMAAFFLSFGVFALLRPDKVRNAMDNLANAWKQGSWHPYRMPTIRKLTSFCEHKGVYWDQSARKFLHLPVIS
jgi:hypothetical protein